MPKSESILTLFAQLLFFKERREQIAPVTFYKRVTLSEWLPSIYKRATLSDSLRLLMTKEQRERFALFTSELVFRSQKTSNLPKKPMSKVPTLPFSFQICSCVPGYPGLCVCTNAIGRPMTDLKGGWGLPLSANLANFSKCHLNTIKNNE